MLFNIFASKSSNEIWVEVNWSSLPLPLVSPCLCVWAPISDFTQRAPERVENHYRRTISLMLIFSITILF